MKLIPFGKPIINKNVIKELKKILDSGQLVHGKYQKEFENSFKKINKSSHVTTVSNCTSGMFLYYLSQKLKKVDEVIVPATTHVATAKKKINSRTKGIVVVHYLGFPVDINKLK